MPLTVELDRSHFDPGNDILDQWLRERALVNEASRAARTFVVTTGDQVVAFYSLSNFAIRRAVASGRVARNMPDPVPAILLGRLAVDRAHQGAGLGKALLRDAFRRVLAVAEHTAVRAVVVHAIDQSAFDFYRRWGFDPLKTDPMELVVLVDDLRHTLTP